MIIQIKLFIFSESQSDSCSTSSTGETLYNSPGSHITVTKKRQAGQSKKVGPKKDILVNVLNNKRKQSTTETVGQHSLILMYILLPIKMLMAIIKFYTIDTIHIREKLLHFAISHNLLI